MVVEERDGGELNGGRGTTDAPRPRSTAQEMVEMLRVFIRSAVYPVTKNLSGNLLSLSVGRKGLEVAH